MSTNNNQSGLAQDVKVKATDMILPATLLFLVFYYPLCLLLQVLGIENVIIADIILVIIYAALCGGLYVIKHQRTMNNIPMSDVIPLINANVGVKFLNWAIITLAVALAGVCVQNGHAILLPAFLSIIVGFYINQSVGQKLWELREPSAAWRPYHNPNFTPTPPQPQQGGRIVTRKYSWTEILNDMGVKTIGADEVEVMFVEADYTDENSPHYVRSGNPFKNGQPMSDADYTSMTATVKAGSGDPYERSALSLIVQSAEEVCDKYHLAEYEMYNLLLRFCQYCIEYKVDDESAAINNIGEYFRFPGETLFDGEGDCDCKSILAYSLFDMLGADADLVTVCVTGDDNPDNLHNHAALILRDNSKKVKLPPTYPKVHLKGIDGLVVYCEPTGKGYKPGEIGPNVDQDSVLVI